MSTVTLRPRTSRKRADSKCAEAELAAEESYCQATKRAKKSRDQTASTLPAPNQKNMQRLSVDLERLSDFHHGFSLDCKENVPPIGVSLRLGGHAPSKPDYCPSNHQQQTLETPPPSTGGGGEHESATTLVTTASSHLQPGKTATRKPVPIASPLSHAHSLYMLAAAEPLTSNSPLPQLAWTDSALLWQQMRLKDTSKPAPVTELWRRHPSIMPTMRTILLDWMLEVCEEYRIHRETYYLALDLFDRFMDTQTNVLKEQLQLIGVTCLFIASKIEEIYPPKLADFAYVTDGACNTEEIVYMELLICKALNWRLHHCSVSVNTWVNLYMQLVSSYFRPPGLKAREFEYPAFSPYEFIRVMQVLDLCTLDITSRQFCNSILAASALYLVSEKCQSHLNLITGFQLTDIQVCVQWMQSYVTVINRTALPSQKAFKGVILQDAHNIQTHEVTITMLDEAIELCKYQESSSSNLLLTTDESMLMDCSALMTPPRQERRCLAPINSTAV